MQGWKLKEGRINSAKLSEDELWGLFNYVFSTRSKNQSSYKFGLIRSLIENLYNVDDKLILSYDKLFSTFTNVYWNLIIKYGLSQSDSSHKQSAIEKVLYTAQMSHEIPDQLSFDQLSEIAQLSILKDIKKNGKRYVFGALYQDMEGVLYGFSNKNEILQFNSIAYTFMKKYHSTIFRLNNYEWAKFLEKNNTVAVGFINSIEGLTKRDSLEWYRNILEENTERKCFYCGKEIKHSVFHVDHFIPWSYLHSDNLWNFVLACQRCNLSKHNNLPEQMFLEKLVERNRMLNDSDDVQVINQLGNYRSTNLLELYKYAERNGFKTGWTPPY